MSDTAPTAVAEERGVTYGRVLLKLSGEALLGDRPYGVDPEFRRRGYARAMLRELLRRAAAEADVRTVRASIRPDNTASLATIAGHGFVHVGEQWDEEDGLEHLYEVPAN